MGSRNLKKPRLVLFSTMSCSLPLAFERFDDAHLEFLLLSTGKAAEICSSTGPVFALTLPSLPSCQAHRSTSSSRTSSALVQLAGGGGATLREVGVDMGLLPVGGCSSCARLTDTYYNATPINRTQFRSAHPTKPSPFVPLVAAAICFCAPHLPLSQQADGISICTPGSGRQLFFCAPHILLSQHAKGMICAPGSGCHFFVLLHTFR